MYAGITQPAHVVEEAAKLPPPPQVEEDASQDDDRSPDDRGVDHVVGESTGDVAQSSKGHLTAAMDDDPNRIRMQ